MKWNLTVGLHLTLIYGGIEANTREEAEEIARDKARKDIVFKNKNLDNGDYGTSIYCAYTVDEESEEEI